MEDVIRLETQHEQHRTVIQFDNSTEYKDCTIVKTEKDGTAISKGEVSVSISNEGVKEINFGAVKLIGREVEMFKEFINQI